MGITKAHLKVSNIDNPEKSFEGEFLVDSGAGYTVVPERVWKRLDIKPEKEQKFALADGKIVKRKIGHAYVQYKDNKVPGQIVLGKKNDSLLFGVITLEQMGLALDPFQRKIYEAKLLL